MVKINNRQSQILQYIQENDGVQNIDIKNFLNGEKHDITRLTIIRDLNFLLEQKLIIKKGKGRNVKYYGNISNPLLTYVDVLKYFQEDINEREVKYSNFNFDIFKYLDKSIFKADELNELEKLNKDYQKRIKKISPAMLKKEFERLTIELSWKSSQMEGNTYTLIDTEILIKENIEAKGHSKEEGVMILNHKKALDYIFNNKKIFKKINLRQIENIHKLLTTNLGIKHGVRKNIVRIIGTNYKPIDNQYQIKEALEKTIKIVNKVKNPIEKAFVLIAMISYIQPFEDGNKRTSRLLSNAVLLAYDYCPLSYRSIDEKLYKKATIIFYESNLLYPLKKLFIEQYKFAVSNYFY